MPIQTIIELDDRRRAPLGRIVRANDRRFLVDVAPNGTITLTPAAVVPVEQAELLQRPEVLDVIERMQADPNYGVRAGRPRRKGSTPRGSGAKVRAKGHRAAGPN